MRNLTKHANLIKYTHYLAMLLSALLIFTCAPAIEKYSKEGEGTTLISVYVNGTLVGTADSTANIDNMVINARKRLAREQSGLVLAKADVVLRGSVEIFGSIDDDKVIEDRIYEILLNSAVKTKSPAYEVRINKYTVNLRTAEEVLTLLETAKNMYDTENTFSVNLVQDKTRELDVLTTDMEKNEEKADIPDEENPFPNAGMAQKFEQFYREANEYDSVGFTLGTKSIEFAENVEVVKTYVDDDDISTLDSAIAEVTKEQEKPKIYEVASGDTLGVIAEKVNIPMDDLIAMNPDILSSEKSVLHVGDELKITAPKPELSILKKEEVYYEEYYNEDVQYVDNNDWYTTQTVTLQQPVEGFRKVIADITYQNNDKIATDIIYEKVVSEAVPKIVERGTKIPPTFLKPISGGRLSSQFGRRKAPKKGASTYHKGVDWATPTGTAVYATSGGTVMKAGWGSGYGYVVYIQHPNGASSRYGHLSKVLVKAGQTVKQGEKIALTGNTGVSTGPHLHFEILMGGAQVNPLKYLQ